MEVLPPLHVTECWACIADVSIDVIASPSTRPSTFAAFCSERTAAAATSCTHTKNGRAHQIKWITTAPGKNKHTPANWAIFIWLGRPAMNERRARSLFPPQVWIFGSILRSAHFGPDGPFGAAPRPKAAEQPLLAGGGGAAEGSIECPKSDVTGPIEWRHRPMGSAC